GGTPLCETEGYTAQHGWICDAGGAHMDEAVATVFRSPRSYTGEDSVEFSCHGGILVTHKVLELLLESGARQAEPGEFTKRAFLNGKIDLSQAEAVADLIAARSRRAHLSSIEQLDGRLAAHVKRMRSSLLDLCSLLEIDLDFAEEGIEVISRERIKEEVVRVIRLLSEMAGSFDVGRHFREGVPAAIVGKPNVGKSSLFNLLLKSDRAIVTPIPGTTRDSLEESITLSGILFRLTDTAGLSKSEDVVEAEGVERSRTVVKRSHLLIVVADATAGEEREDVLAQVGKLRKGQVCLVAHNKIDLLPGKARGPRQFRIGENVGLEVWISAKTGEGVERMKEALVLLLVGSPDAGEGGFYLTNRRHKDAIDRSRSSLETAMNSVNAGATNEFVAFDVREAIEVLSEITGEVTNEEILNSIFGRFCIGK
ncbi:MAG: tRNA uridine-5-carboxymethylaminomethyl(34) synthesis GTPase MnmE, partial [Bacteroidota bacterium]